MRLAAVLVLLMGVLSAWQGCESYQPASVPTAAPGSGPTPASGGGRATAPTTPGAPAAGPRVPPLTPVATIRTEPTVRVRVVSNDRVLQLTANGPLQFAPPAGQPIQLAPPVTVTRSGRGYLLRPASGQAAQWDVAELYVRTTTGSVIGVGAGRFPGVVSLHFARDEQGLPLPGIDAVNHVGVEAYLPGVLEHELYGAWQPEAYRAQAIAARSYAIDRTTRNRDRTFDLESNTRSQMYGGVSTRGKAIDAVRATHGQVLAWQGNVVPGYYSSDSGGLGQDAAIAFPGERAIPPLGAHDHGGWSQQAGSTKFRWGPVSRDRGDLSRRMAAWGAVQKPRDPVASLRLVTHIAITQRNRLGRPAQFTITDSAGQRFVLGPEQFRFACNYQAPGMPPVDKATQLYSSSVEVNVAGDRVVFTAGRGFGHGVGMCQWGAQGMAAAGHRHPQILAEYYPGASIVKAY